MMLWVALSASHGTPVVRVRVCPAVYRQDSSEHAPPAAVSVLTAGSEAVPVLMGFGDAPVLTWAVDTPRCYPGHKDAPVPTTTRWYFRAGCWVKRLQYPGIYPHSWTRSHDNIRTNAE